MERSRVVAGSDVPLLEDTNATHLVLERQSRIRTVAFDGTTLHLPAEPNHLRDEGNYIGADDYERYYRVESLDVPCLDGHPGGCLVSTCDYDIEEGMGGVRLLNFFPGL